MSEQTPNIIETKPDGLLEIPPVNIRVSSGNINSARLAPPRSPVVDVEEHRVNGQNSPPERQFHPVGNNAFTSNPVHTNTKSSVDSNQIEKEKFPHVSHNLSRITASESRSGEEGVRITTMSADKKVITGYTNEYSKIKIAKTSDSSIMTEPHGSTEETKGACQLLMEALDLRKKYDMNNLKTNEKDIDESKLYDTTNIPPKMDKISYKREFGVFEVSIGDKKIVAPADMMHFIEDYTRIRSIMASGPCRTYTYQRLKVLEYKYDIHRLMNDEMEALASRADPKSFSNVVKVDTHVHLAAGMTSRHLLDFIKRKLQYFADDLILQTKDGQTQSLKNVLKKLKIEPENLTVNSLDVYADNTFQRFDNFNAKYNPFGLSELRTVFLKIDNYGKGKYFAELTKELFEKMEKRKWIKAEYRISIYGRKASEWNDLANWVFDNKVYSECNVWLIQMPRIYDVFKSVNVISSFAEMIDNIFQPLFEVTKDPSKNPKLHSFLKQISGFDSVDDESKPEGKLTKEGFIYPENWTTDENPSYTYYVYYCWANIYTLNKLREARGMNTFDFRPHSGESGEPDHLGATFLLAKGINHGINLEKSTVLQYLFYITQIGIACSPLSNNSLFLDYKRNPFPLFFRRGLNVSLSTDDPLQFHLTENPILEEYEIAAKRWRFTSCDISEIARNSVLQSGFSHERKVKWLGPRYLEPDASGNDIAYTNVPNMRISYRYETLKEEISMMHTNAEKIVDLVPFSFSFVSPQEGTGVVMPMFSKEDIASAVMLYNCLQRRKKYNLISKDVRRLMTNPTSSACDYEFRRVDGVMMIFRTKEVFCSYDSEELATVYCSACDSNYCEECDKVLHKPKGNSIHLRSHFKAADSLTPVIPFEEFVRDCTVLERTRTDPSANTFAGVRLRLLELCFKLYELLNTQFERESMRKAKVDFETIYKVDTHVHLAGAPTADHFLDFMKRKMMASSEEQVYQEKEEKQKDRFSKEKKEKNEPKSLREVFEKIGIQLENLTTDSLDVKASMSTFGFFDKLSNTYNPFGSNQLRHIFLKRENFIKGRYFAELCKEVFSKQEKNAHTLTEYRVSVYGRRKDEWSDLARWIDVYKVQSDTVRWVVQVPRLYHVYREKNLVANFQEFLDNIFVPLFQVTQDPLSNTRLHNLLPYISGFDSVDDESYSIERPLSPDMPLPKDWKSKENPPFAYYMYYMWANIYTLNKFRELRKLTTFSFRPHCGAVGSRSHLSATFLIVDGIAHGLNLVKAPTLQYLYYLDQIGLYLSPLGEDAICCEYEQNPFYTFFKRGLNVSLSSDNPLQLHSTDEPLMEEYSIAAKMWKLSQCDMSELARNSILQSGLEHEIKEKFLGPNYNKEGTSGNDIQKSNLPNVRVHFRSETLQQENSLLAKMVKNLGSEVTIEWLKNENTNSKLQRKESTEVLPPLVTRSTSEANMDLRSKLLKKEDISDLIRTDKLDLARIHEAEAEEEEDRNKNVSIHNRGSGDDGGDDNGEEEKNVRESFSTKPKTNIIHEEKLHDKKILKDKKDKKARKLRKERIQVLNLATSAGIVVCLAAIAGYFIVKRKD